MIHLNIQTQMTPNPDAKKYILNFDVKRQGRISYTNSKDCEHIPMIAELLLRLDLEQVHLFKNILTITKKEQQEWDDLDVVIRSILEEQFPDHDPDFSDKNPQSTEHFTVEMKIIDGILEREIRPFLQADGGDVQLVGYENNILTIRYQGACGGCPSSQLGTLDAMTNLLQEEYNPNIEIVSL